MLNYVFLDMYKDAICSASQTCSNNACSHTNYSLLCCTLISIVLILICAVFELWWGTFVLCVYVMATRVVSIIGICIFYTEPNCVLICSLVCFPWIMFLRL